MKFYQYDILTDKCEEIESDWIMAIEGDLKIEIRPNEHDPNLLEITSNSFTKIRITPVSSNVIRIGAVL